MPLAAWLIAMVGPLVVRILAVLGISLVTYQGFDLVMTEFINLVSSSFGALPASILQLVRLTGIVEGMHIIGSAIATKLLILSYQSASSLFVRTPT